MHRRSYARRSDIDLAGIGLGIGDEFRKRVGGDRRIDQEHHRKSDQSGDRLDIADKIEIELLVERCVDRVRRHHVEERVAVRRSGHHRFRGDVAAGAGALLDHEGLAQARREPLPDQPRYQVWRTAAAKTLDNAHRPRRIVLAMGKPRSRRHDSRGAEEPQKFST